MAGYKVKESLLWRMKGGAAPVLEDTQHVTYPNLAQIENGFVQIANYICLTLKQCFLGEVLVVSTETHMIEASFVLKQDLWKFENSLYY